MWPRHLSPWAHEHVGVEAEPFCCCRFPPPYSWNRLWWWFTCTLGSYSAQNISLADGSTNRNPHCDCGAWLRRARCCWVIIVGGGVRERWRGLATNKSMSSHVAAGPEAWRRRYGDKLRKCGHWCDCDSSCHIQVTWRDKQTHWKKKSEAQERAQAEELLPCSKFHFTDWINPDYRKAPRLIDDYVGFLWLNCQERLQSSANKSGGIWHLN